MINNKIQNLDSKHNIITSTHLVGIRETAKEINKVICENLPTNECGINS
ncbi:4451_t:CDS:1, partial [Gigaspora rosea]